MGKKEFEGLGIAGREWLEEIKRKKKEGQKVVATKKKETLIIGQRLMEVLPMLIPLEKVKLDVVDVWMDEQDEAGKPTEKQWGVFCKCERQWADGLITYEIAIPLNLLRRVVIPGRFSRKLLLALTDLARKRRTLEPEFTKGELGKAMGFTEERLRKSGEFYELVDCALSVWSRMHIGIKMGKGKYWKDFVRWEGGPIDAFGWRVREKGKGAKLYVRFSKELFGDPQFIRLRIDRLGEVLPRDETYFLDVIDAVQGFPIIPFGVRRLFTERLGYTNQQLIHLGSKEIKKRLKRMLGTAKEKGRLRKPFYQINEKGNKNALDWVIKLYLSVDRTRELRKEIFEWMEKSPGYDDTNKYKIRAKVTKAIKQRGVEWVRETFDWYEAEGKHPADFWKAIDDGPDRIEREEIEERKKLLN